MKGRNPIGRLLRLREIREEQARGALAAIDRTLTEAGTDKTRILTATVFIADMAEKPALNRAWDAWVSPGNAPLRACLGVALEGQDRVEVLVTAALPGR